MPKPSDRRYVDLIEFARRLVVTLDALGYSKARFARSVGATPGQLHHWTIGGNFPSAEVLINIARVHGIGCEWLLLGRMDTLPVGVAQKIQAAAEKRNNLLSGN